MCAGDTDWKIILGVAASDVHIVANQLIALELRERGYRVVNLGACTTIAEFASCQVEHPDALAVMIGSLNGHAVEDLRPLPAARSRGLLCCPVVVGGNLSVGSRKRGDEEARVRAPGVDHVLSGIDELTELLPVLAAGPRQRSATGRHRRVAASPFLRVNR
jgi:methylaspartate mutase sigma subunit